MGVSTDGQICFGILLEEEIELPWEEEKFDHDIEDWWRHEKGFKPSVELADEKGEWIGGVAPSKEVWDQNYQERKAFLEANPLPIEMVNTCSHNYSVWIVAAPSTIKVANRGNAQPFNPSELVVTDAERQAVIDFCKTYGLESPNPDPQWYLSSYWG